MTQTITLLSLFMCKTFTERNEQKLWSETRTAQTFEINLLLAITFRFTMHIWVYFKATVNRTADSEMFKSEQMSTEGFQKFSVYPCPARKCLSLALNIVSFRFSSADINECTSSPCDANAKCSNTIGSYTCQCNSGYSGNGSACTGIWNIAYR